MPHSKTLQSLHVLVTRPSGLGATLCSDIEQLGGKSYHFPVIQIEAPKDPTSLTKGAHDINAFDMAVFISPTAALETAKHINLSTLSMTTIALGSSTASTLKELGLNVDIIPDGHNSESLLEHPKLQSNQVENKHIIIFKGEGGRPLLSDTLSSRGANVTSANMYRRTIPTQFKPLTPDQINKTDVILVTSGEGINNLLKMTEEKTTLLNKRLIVPGARCSEIAKQLGFRDVIEADNATNAALISVLVNNHIK